MSGFARSPIEAYLHDLHARYRDLNTGTVADYIPELGKADPKSFGICVATIDGHVYEVGDTQLPFTIQSISKPFVYGLALGDRGKQAVIEKISVEPTGDAFNEISLAPDTGRPLNPMINAGAIAATSLVVGHSDADRWNRILALFSTYAGRDLELNEAVYRSEADTGHRNRAISYMLRNFDIIDQDPEPSLDLYFRQCSIEVTARDLSVMAATLATGGVNPLNGDRALEPSNSARLQNPAGYSSDSGIGESHLRLRRTAETPSSAALPPRGARRQFQHFARPIRRPRPGFGRVRRPPSR
jgi:glutaminase